MNTLEHLPDELSKHRILSAAQAAELWGVSLPLWRRLYRAKAVPSPIKLSERRLGWRASDLIDGLENRAQSAA
jgi:predicted DNA-binding transcriptional regulator AlpA